MNEQVERLNALIQQTNMPAVFIETVFLNNPNDVTKVYYSSSRNKIASALAGAVKTWDDWGVLFK